MRRRRRSLQEMNEYERVCEGEEEEVVVVVVVVVEYGHD